MLLLAITKYFLLFALVIRGVLSQCLTVCSTDADCAGCANKVASDLPDATDQHDFFLLPGVSVSFECFNNECRLDVSSVSIGDLNDCLLPETRGCCVKSGTPATDIANCQAKRCKQAAGCNDLGYCEYGPMDAYDGCCRQNPECPDTPRPLSTPAPPPAPPGSAAAECLVKQCTFGSCNYEQAPNCCLLDADCTEAAFEAQVGRCVDDITSPTGKSCEYVFKKFETCTSDFGCGDTNVCANSACVGNQCQMTQGSAAVGCCSASDTSQCLETACLKKAPVPCNTAESTPVPGFTILPDFNCNFVDRTGEGCCEDNDVCAESQIACFGSECDFFNNLCQLNARNPVTNERCCYYSAQCGIRNTQNLCVYSECSGPVVGSVTAENAFQCIEKTTTNCNAPPTPAPAAGLVPTLTLTRQTSECDWVCGVAPNNNVVLAYTVANPGGSGRVLYGFDLRLFVDNGLSTQTIVAVTLNSLEISTDGRPVPPGLFTSGTSSIVDGKFEQTFVSSEPFSLHPGEVLTATFETIFVGDAAVTNFNYILRVVPYDQCVEYWFGQPNCADQSDAENENRIERSAQSDNLESVGFNNDPCDPQCLGGTLAPTSTTGGMVTPMPTGPTSVVSGSRTHLRETTVKIDNCQWNCADQTDTAQNILTFEVTERLLTGTAVQPARAYEFQFDFETSCGSVTFYDIAIAPPADNLFVTDLATGFGFGFVTNNDPNVLFALFGELTRGPVLSTLPSRANIPAGGFSFRAAFPLSGQSPGIDCVPSSGVMRLRTFKDGVQCTAAAVSAGVCDQANLGLIVNVIQRLPPLEFTFGAGQCSVPCPLRTFGSFSADILLRRPQCAWNCDADADPVAKNLIQYQICFDAGPSSTGTGPFAFITDLVFAFRNDALEDITESGAFFSGGITITGAGIDTQVLTRIDPSVYIGLARVATFDPPIFVPGNGETCVTLSVYRIDQIALEIYTLVARFLFVLPCSGHELELRTCRKDDAFYPPFLNNTQFSSPAPDSGELALTDDFCGELCPLSSVGTGKIGGIVFLDFDVNGYVSGNDTLVPGIFVQAVNAATNTLVATSLTNGLGVFEFDPAPIFAVATRIYFRILAVNFPFGTRPTVLGAQNPSISNNFFGDPYRSNELTAALSTRQQNAGFRLIGDEDACQPSTGPFDNDGVVVRQVSSECTACAADAPFVGQCGDIVCGSADQHQIVEIEYTISNFGATPQPGTSVTVQFEQIAANVPLSDLLCVDAQAAELSPDMVLIREQTAVLGGSKSRPALVVIGWPSLPRGTDVHRFRVRFAYCANNDALQFNVTATVYGDYCVALLRSWRTCAASNPDFRECYAENVVNTDTLTCPGCAAPPTFTPLPPGATLPPGVTLPPTPAPTFGPVGANTPIKTLLRFVCEGAMCVTKPRIVQQLCTDEQAAFDTCLAAVDRGIVIARGTLELVPGPPLSESGVFRLVVQRNMDAATLFCRDFDTEIRLSAVRNGVPLEGTLAVLNSDVDAATQRMEIDVAFLPFDDETEIVIEARALECLPALDLIDYTAELTIFSNECTNATACTVKREFSGSKADADLIAAACSPLPDEPVFASADGPGTNVGKKYNALAGTGLSTAAQVIIYAVLALSCLCCVCCLCCFVARGRTGAAAAEAPTTEAPTAAAGGAPKACKPRRKITVSFGSEAPSDTTPLVGSNTRKRTNKGARK